MRNAVKILSLVISFLLSALCYTGILYPTDQNGRIIVGSIWLLIGLFWIFGLIKKHGDNPKNNQQMEE